MNYSLTTLSVVALVILAGCATTGPAPGTTESPSPTTQAPTTAGNFTTTENTTTTTQLDATVSFNNCTAVTIDAESFEWVGVFEEGGATEFEGDYSGEHTFTTETPIDNVLVASESGDVEVNNPDYEDCITPDPTPTTTPTPTQTVTSTPTPTTAPTPTTTTTIQHHTHTTPTTTTIAPPSKVKISVLDPEETLGESASFTGRVWSTHDYTVRLNFDVVYYKDGPPGGDDIMVEVDRIPMTIKPGEEKPFDSTYGSNNSIVEIEYTINDLERHE